MTDAFCREGMRYAAGALRRVYENGADKEARERMSLASLLGGLALANSGLGAVHGFAGPLGGMLHAPHGAICARLLPFVVETNFSALLSRQPEHPALARYAEMAQILTASPEASIAEGVLWMSKLVRDLDIPSLSAYGMTRAQFPEAVEKTLKSSSFRGNPVPLTEAKLMGILERAL